MSTLSLVSRQEPLPLSFAQQRLWLIDQLEPGSPLYNMPLAWSVEGPLDAGMLARCLGEIERRHESLRTVFPGDRDGAPVQVIRPASPFVLPVVDLSGLPESRREPQALVLAGEEAARPFDLARGPLLRGVLLRLAASRGSADHVAALTVHHIASDGWSLGILVREIAELYAAFAAGRPSPLPELPMHYADFAVWQHSWLRGEILESEISFWRRQLAGLPSLLELPTDRPRPAVQSYRGASRPVLLPAALTGPMEALARREGATLFMVLLAAFQALLARHSGQDDLAVGSSVAGRNRAETEGLIGLFVNPLVLRGDLSGELSFRELLGRVRETVLAAHLHQDVPFEKLVEELSPERSIAHTVLFQVMLALQSAPAGSLEIGDLRFRPVAGAGDTGTLAKLDLTLSLGETAEGLAGAVEYVADLFDAATIDRFIGHLAHLLAGATAEPGTPLSELRLMGAAEERELLQWGLDQSGRTWAVPSTDPITIHDLFLRQAARTPGRDAAIDLGGTLRTLTYGELAERSLALAGHIRSVLPCPLDRPVALLADAGPLVLAGMLGILRAGAGFVPLDPRLPDERLAWILEDAACGVLVTQKRHLARMAGLGLRHVVCLEDAVSSGPVSALRAESEGGSFACLARLAYIVYTSGSTGRPKGVQISHQNLLPMLLWGIDHLGLGAESRVLQSLSFCFDFGIFEFLTALLAGGTLVFPGEAAGDPLAFAREIVRQGIDTLHTTPAFARELAAAGVEMDSLTVLHIGGEALSRDTVARLRQAAPRAVLYNGYGPTEATVNSSIYRIGGRIGGQIGGESEGSPWPTVPTIPIGRPSADNALYVLDRTGRPVPFGVRGELHVGGIGVARGYLNRPELTAERFVADPFGSSPGGRLYRTGDLVRYLPGGDVEFLGRLDHQVKIRGFRIELGEIEESLRTLPAVREAVVVARQDRLVAYVVGEASPDALRLSLQERLPGHMVPSVFVTLEALPLTATGKVDRKALQAPERQRPEAGWLAPRTPVEEVVAGIWAEVLGLERVGAADHFFALGGHSLSATRVMALLHSTFGIEVPLRVLFEAPTVAGLAERLGSTLRAEKTASLPLVPVPRLGRLRLSFAQQRLWLAEQMEDAGASYNLPFVLRLSGPFGPVEHAALEGSLGELIRRHESLRVRIVEVDGEPYQEIREDGPGALLTVDLSSLPPDRREAELEAIGRREAGRPFDLTAEPLLRVFLWRLAAEEHALFFNQHHLISDAWSLDIFLRDLAALYTAFLAGAPADLPELPVQYADYAVWQRRWLSGDAIGAAVDHWCRRLAGVPVLDLPPDHPRPAVRTFRGAWRSLPLHPELAAGLRHLGRQENATLFMVLLAGLQGLLGRYAAQDDFAVGVPVANRGRLKVEHLIGFFINMIALRADLSGAPSLRQLLARVRAASVDGFAHQGLPFERLVEELAPERDPGTTPIFQVTFQHLISGRPPAFPGLSARLLPLSSGTAKFDLSWQVEEGEAGLAAVCEHSTDLFDGTTVQRMLEHFVALLAGAVASPDLSLAELPLWSEAQRHQALFEWNETTHDLMAEKITSAFPRIRQRAGGGIDFLERIGRRALAVPAPAAAESGPATPVGELLAKIWGEVLGLQTVSSHDNFFHAGGHSLLVASLLSRVRKTFGVEIPLRVFFQAPTLSSLEAAVAKAASGEPGGIRPLQAIAPAPRRGYLPLSFAQEALWLIHLLSPLTAVYNIPLSWRLSGPLDAAALAASLSEIARRHEVLRTRFAGDDAHPGQAIRPPAPFPLPRIDLSGLPPEMRESELGRLLREEAGNPIDLGGGALVRGRLTVLGACEHALQITLHHAVFDGLSVAILSRELAALYAAYRSPSGPSAALPDLPVQYADFAVWQRSWLTGAVLEGLAAWWRTELAGAPQALDLPSDRPRGRTQTFRGAALPVAIPATLSAEIPAFGRREGVTPFMVFLAAFQMVLHRFSGQDDVLVGSPVANRPRPELEELIGYFVNSVVLRGRFERGGATVRDLLARTRATALGVFAHQDLPFDRVVAELQVEREPSRNPLFQAMLSVEPTGEGDLSLSGLAVEPVDAVQTLSMFDFTLILRTEQGRLGGQLEYSAHLFDGATARHLADGFTAVLTAVLTALPGDPGRRLDEVSLLTAAEVSELRTAAGRHIGPRREPRLLHELFAAQAARTPEAVALLTPAGERVTYAGLDRRSDLLAVALRRRGVGPEVPVGVCLERSPELVTALLGVLKAGGVYLPLDPAYPRDRLAFMLDDAGVRLVVTTSRLAAGLPADAPPVLALDLPGAAGDGGGEAAVEIAACSPVEADSQAESLAYVIYTSGSTGRPKGTGISHRWAAEHMAIIAGLWGLCPADRVLVSGSPSFDISLEEILPALISGAALVVRGAELWSSAELPLTLAELGVTVVDLPTAYWHVWAAESDVSGRPQDLALRLVMVGGEAMSTEAVYRWRRSPLAGIRLFNSYGPTEAIVTAAALEVDGAAAGAAGAVVPLGAPLPGRSAWVLDLCGHPVPAGAGGELCLGGPLLARGYLGRPDLTAERFVPDPFSGDPGARLYRTGDRVRRCPDGAADGSVEFLGRIDRQVKVRGFRVEPGEVEAALARHPAVREAVADTRDDGTGNLSLVAWVVFADAAPPLAELRDFLRASLPAYLVPSALVALPELPLTAGGKVDRRALPEPAAEWLRDGESEPPRDAMEETVAGIWAEVLGRGRVGRRENFFQLGGHSLRAVRVVALLRRRFGIEVPLRALFETPTVAELAAWLETVLRTQRAGAIATAPPLVPVPPVSRQEPLPLSFAQQSLWLSDQLEPGSPLYNMPLAWRVEGPLDAGVLARCLGEIERRHESLRTVFALSEEGRDGAPVQVIRPAAPFVLPVVDLSGLPGLSDLRQALALVREESLRPFDLARGPLLRGVLLRLAASRGAADHVAALTVHHIASDGWSLGILVREIAELYPAFAAGRPSPLPELPVQYADFAVWQHSWLRGEVLESEISFWRRQLAGLPSLLELPTDRPRPAVQSHRGASRPVLLPAALTRPMEALARREGATLFMVLLAAFQALLARHSGQDDLAVGSPVAGRNRAEIEGLIGLFVNPLVLRGDLSGNQIGEPTFRELLGRVRETVLAAHLHQDVPFEKLVQELAPERSIAHTALFQVMLALQSAPAGSLEIGDLRFRPVAGGTRRTLAKLDLTLSLGETAEGLAGAVEYAADLFDAATIDRFIGHLAHLLAGATAEPGTLLSELRLMDAAEERELLQWGLGQSGRTWAVPPTHPVIGWMGVHDLFLQQAARTPGRDAAVDLGGTRKTPRTLTYGDIAERSLALAGHIRSVLPRPLDRPVALLADAGPLVLAGMLGILRAGAGFVPLDPRLPDERLAWILEDAACEVLVTQKRHLARLAGLGLRHVLCLEDAVSSRSAAESEGCSFASLSRLAYIVYTSGSTGRPKGVQISHQNLVPMLLWGIDYLGLGAESRVLQSLSFCFDFGIFEFLTALLAGGTLVFPGDAAGDPLAFAREIVRQGIDTLHTTPAFARELAAAGVELDSLTVLHIGGEALSRDTVARLRQAAPRAALYNGYGPTEATVNSSIYRIGDSSPWPIVPIIPIGRPSADNALYILDRTGRPVPFGVRGELHVGGVGVARGYLNRPELTAERFVPDPFGSSPGGRLYRTGDLVRYLPGGDVDFLGRLDHQVKIRGFRIELGEIEEALRTLPGVREAVVVARQDQDSRRLVAYVVGEASPDALRLSLQERLPGHMVPSAFVTLEALPLTATGKVDRKALQAPERQRPEEGWLAPRTPVEEVVAGIWAEVLGLERVGAADHFFALGGHSLSATRVMALLHSTFGIEVPLRVLFEAPTVAGLAERLGSTLRAEKTASLPLVPVPRLGRLRLSFAQQRLWLVERMEKAGASYNLPFVLRLSGPFGPVEHAALEASLGELIRRHESLRVRIVEVDGEPYQEIREDGPGALPTVDLSSLPPDRREAELEVAGRREAGRPFDLTAEPLLRVFLWRLAAAEHALFFNQHHLISDAWSLDIFLRDLAALYTAFLAGGPADLPELPVQYADYAVWQRRWLSGKAIGETVDYWRRHLAGVPALELPCDRSRPAVRTFRGASRSLPLRPELAAGLRRLGAQENATAFMVLLAGLQSLLGRYAAQEDFAVGVPVANRGRLEIENLIGFFVNMIALRADLSGAPGFRQLLARVRTASLDGFAHQGLPFERLVEELAPERNLAMNPIFQVTFQVLVDSRPAAFPGLPARLVALRNGTAQFDLSWEVEESEDGLTVTCEHAADLFDGTSVQRMLEHFVTLLGAAVEAPDLPLAELALWSEAQRQQALCEWNDTRQPFPAETLCHELVAAQARRRPAAPAVVWSGGRLSYGELDERADRLARALRALGVGPEVRTGVCLQRSPELIVAILAVLKAGGAYVALDPAHHEERLIFQLEDSQTRVLLALPGRAAELAAERGIRCLPPDALAEPGPDPGDDPGDAPAVLGGNLACVIYTSDSTGPPKGVEISHRSLLSLATLHDRTWGVTADDRAALLSGAGFGASVWETWPCLAAGASLCVVPEPVRTSTGELRDWMVAERITVSFVPALLAEGLMAEDWPAETALRLLLTGGDRLDSHPSASLPFRVVNAYGPAEGMVICTLGQVLPGGDAAGRAPTIGRPVANAGALIVDRGLRLVPPGVPGELLVGGTVLARGYLGRPDLTAERFVPAPAAIETGEPGEPGARVYRTGDLVRFRDGGDLDFLGRIDHQAKIRGRLAAAAPAAAAGASDGPRNPVEQLIAGLWEEILDRSPIHLDDNFFHLGGHSLLATRVLSRVREAFAMDMPLQTLFSAPTVRGLARAVAAARRGELDGAMPLLRPVPRGGLFPLSFPQQRLWFVDRLAPGGATYNMPAVFLLRGGLDVPALTGSLTAVVQRHESLRTRFVEVDGRPWQEILPPEPLAMPLVDLGGLPEERRRHELARLGREEADRPFDLRQAPLLRAALIRLEADEHALSLNMHHIISDGWSEEILIRELEELYAAGRSGLPAQLAPLPIQYADFAVWQRAWPERVMAEQLAYWTGSLSGLATLEVPTDRPRPPLQTFRGSSAPVFVPPPLAAKLRELGWQRQVTPFMFLLAAWQAVLHRVTGQTDVAVGSPVANRNRPEVEGLIGFFVNMLPLRADFTGAPTFAEMLGRVRRVALESYDHADVPFERLVDELKLERDLSRQPLVQVMFVLQSGQPTMLRLPGLEVSPLDFTGAVAKFDLTLGLADDEGAGLSGLIEYNSDLFDGTTVLRFGRHLASLLAAVAAQPDARAADIDLLTQAERHQLLREWNDTRAPFPAEMLLQQHFEASADRAPEAVAALWAGERITYGGLEARANRIAGLLRHQGIERGAPVGVWMERSLDMLAAVLGILKAGGYYVPLDPAWPAERVEAILAETSTPLVLTRSAHLGPLLELRWRLPALGDVVYLDVDTPAPAPEAVDAEGLRAVFDLVAERAVDRATAGGFISSFTGEPFSDAEVDEYRDRVLALAAPWLGEDGAAAEQRVLEIGSGSGLILWEIAPRVRSYTGLDPSPLTQQRNRDRAAELGLGNVELPVGFAHEIESWPEGSFDLVILASTAQFFPGPLYLERIVAQAMRLLAPGGALLFADVPDARRQGELRQAREEHDARAGQPPRRQDPHKILSFDEDLFRDLAALPLVAEVSVLHRETGFANELRFRYDVVLSRRSEPGTERLRRKRLWTSWHVERCAASRPVAVTSPDDLAYVIYTSGSTGQPKGILVQHRSVANLIAWINGTLGIGTDDRVLFVTSLCFDLSVWDIFGMLAAGGSVQVATEDELRDPERLVQILRGEPVTVWDSAPAALVRLAPLFPAAPAVRSRLRRVLLSGDWIPVTLPERVRAAFPGAQITSLGGATEATVWSNWYPVREVDPAWPSIPYGRPIANAFYHVLDAGLTPRPAGVPGDLYIGGGVLCTGYARQAALTAASFLPDPFSTEPGARLYRTGDRARWFAGGDLEFLGRVDQQVKIRGFRIELGEIEVALARHPGIREAVVLAREDVPGDKRLVAYVVPRAGSPAPGAAELRELLRHGLPEYMLPAAFVELPALPVTPNGKLDRRALPAPDRAEGGEEALPVTPTEERLAAIWRELLGVERIGRFDSFFELGGHSLLATQLVARLREAFGAEVALRTVFQSPVLADLAAALDAGLAARAAAPQAAAEVGAPEILPIPRDGREGELPLSASQLRQWFLVQLEPDSPAYNLPIHVRLDGELQPAALAAALQEILRRHEGLRTTFTAAGGKPAAVISPPSPLALPVVDLGSLPGALRDLEARRIAAAELAHRFDLTRGPLFRTVLLRLAGGASGEHLLAGTFHHIIFDGFSLGVFLRELAALYETSAAGRPSPLPELAVQYVDYAAWQRDWLASPALEAEIGHWRERLEGASQVLHLPTDRPRPAVQTHNGHLFALDIPAGLGGALKGLSARGGATLFMVLLAGYSTVLSRYSGQDDFTIGTFVANRRREVLERIIGFFVNTIVLRADLTGNPTFRELLARLREITLDAFEHQEVPFERLLEELDIERDVSRTPLFQVLFGVQNFAIPTLQAGGLTMRLGGTDEDDRTNTDLTYWMWEEDGDLKGWVQYSTDLYDRATMERLFRHMATLLTAGAADPGLRLSELPLLPDAERQQILGTWSAGGAHPHSARLVHERMREQARRAPEAPAVVAAGRTLTYGELDRRAGQVARGLRRHGAGPETVIGLCIDRSPEMIVALYGILAAGAAYLPLDPALPAERLALFLGETGAPLVLSRRGLPLPELPVPVLHVDSDFSEERADESTDGLPATAALPESTAYILYTSGSTGRPKGVMVEHRALAAFVAAALETYGIGADDRVLQFASPSFDTSAEEIYPCLAAGGCLVLRNEEMIASPARFWESCRAAGITVLDLPTAWWHELAATAATAAGGVPPLPDTLRLVILGGEAVLPERVRSWLAALPSRPRLFNTYGPTEGTVVATACDLAETAPAVPVGRPIRGVEVYLLDRELTPAPTGVPGEICLGGADLARGYLGRPDLTAERFTPSPFGGPGERLYHTGDLGRWLPSGQIDFAGRADDQVKIRGFRIEPGEVAAALSRHLAVREAVVVAREAGAGERRLVAYAVPADFRTPLAAADLRSFLKELLPAYMVPADIVLLEALPLTRTGKIDRKALPAVDGTARGDDGGYAPPETATEELLAEIWRDLLGVERVGIYDNFFDLGGHSLLVPQLISRIGDIFQVELPLRALFEVPTVAQMATALEEMLLAQIEELSDEEAASLVGGR